MQSSSQQQLLFDSSKDDLIELVGESSYEIEQNEERSEGVISSCIASGALRLRYLSTFDVFLRTRADLFSFPVASVAPSPPPPSTAADDGVRCNLCVFCMAERP